MEKRYAYSRNCTTTEYVLLLLASGCLFLVWFLALYGAWVARSFHHVPFVTLALNVTVAIAFVVIARTVFVRELSETKFIITETSITKRSLSDIITVAFDQIFSFKFTHVPVLYQSGGLRYRHGTMTFPFRLSGLSCMLKRLEPVLRSAGAMVDHDNILAFRHIAICNELSGKRLKRYMPGLAVSQALFLCVVMSTSIFIWHYPQGLTMFFAIVAQAFFMTAVIVSELVLFALCKNKLLSKTPLCRTALSQTVYARTFLVWFIAYFAVTVYIIKVYQG
jgi:hypothetical protein